MTALQNESGILAGEERMLIGGELVEAEGGRKFDVENPATEEIVGQVADGTGADMSRAIGIARETFDNNRQWREDADFRHHCLTQLSEALDRNREKLRRVVVTEVGVPVSATMAQIDTPLLEPAFWAEKGKNWNYLEDTGIHEGYGMKSRRLTKWSPVGVVGSITPWNTPLYLNIAETIPALMAGNAVVLKPAQLTPWSGTEYGKIIAEETDIPAGIFQVVTSNDNEVGAALTTDPRVDMISFTGSTATGKRVLAAASSTVKKVVLELGGKSAHILTEDADFATFLPGAAMMTCIQSGQSCVLTSRLLVPRSRYEEALEFLKAAFEQFPYGDPWNPAHLQGPQIAGVQWDKVQGMISQAISDGARLVTGGLGRPEGLEKGWYTKPTLFADVDPNSELGQEEVFGPVLAVLPYDTIDEAIAIANNSPYGLSGQVTAGDPQVAFDIASRINTGSMTVNGGGYFGLTSPFGGTKQSGLGRRNGNEGFAEYMESMTIGVPEGFLPSAARPAGH